jgi:hypothetical protein
VDNTVTGSVGRWPVYEDFNILMNTTGRARMEAKNSHCLLVYEFPQFST